MEATSMPKKKQRWGISLGGLIICLTSACHQPASTPSRLSPTPELPATPQAKQSLPALPPASPERNTTKRWLYAEQFTEGTSDGFIEGDFSARRNRLTIKTHDVTRFAIDTRHLAINWEKLVVIQINGTNSELRRRDDPVLHFVLDRFKQWVVDE